ncbi:MAG: 3-deoxy-D-manno-octulosonic acid transferase, partial [Methylotenera sp.]|nr:3-deoxy-D-manno-octulosonic acid transferase [Methylotenera sp.]
MTRTIYTVLLYLLLPFAPLKLLWRARKQPEYLQHCAERFGFYSATVKKPIIWLHCVSVGETRAASLLVKLLQAEFTGHQVLLSHTTPTGRAASEQLFGDSVQRVYLPYDTPFAVSRFLSHYKPSIGVLMETELWFNLIQACKDKNIPLLLLNARLSAKSAQGYTKLGKLMQEGLHDLTAIGTQADADSQRFQALGAQNISVMGNI